MLKQIGKYTIGGRIGRGTYSRVYRAADSHGRPVAIKVSTTRTEPEQLSEFQRDLVAAASVLHPNLAAVHDLGFEDDFPYLVMELVEGRDLDKVLKSNAAPSLAERIHVMQQVGEALKSAHQRGVLHLDIRPSKIMLADDGAVKLLNLGLGRLSFDPARVTDLGYLVGAPFYMSPERLTAINTANERCDIWSFGVTFYEWISGRHPFYDDDGDRMIGKIMDAAPAPLAGVPDPLKQAILRAIEKEPAGRYRNFGELLADLKTMVSDLKREESDALMVEALKQTDSGRWHEARRIARQMRDLEPQEGPSSQIFDFSEREPVAELEHAATVLGTPEPAAPAVQRQTFAQPVAMQPAAVPQSIKLQRPERTAPTANNGAPRLTAGSETDTASAEFPPRPPASSPQTALARSTVRILEMEEPSGFQWVKILSFAVPALLLIGALFFFLRSSSKISNPLGDSSEEAKQISAAHRVIKGDHVEKSAIPASSQKPPDPVATTTPSPDTAQLRLFDPKSLIPIKAPAPPRRRGNGEIPETVTLPVALNAPPPPAPVVKRVTAETPQSVDALQNSANHTGGVFAQPELVKAVKPVYPPPAVQRKAQGVVRFQATITKDGSVKDLQLVSGDPLLNVSAKQAVLQWKYRPAMLNGAPVEVTQAIIVMFNLDQ